MKNEAVKQIPIGNYQLNWVKMAFPCYPLGVEIWACRVSLGVIFAPYFVMLEVM